MSRFPTAAALIAALASTVALAVPATAGAAVTPTVQNNTLTVKGDEDPDAITLTAAAGVLVVNGTPTTLAANGVAQIVVESGAGNDVVDASALAAASYGSLALDGETGDDVLTGGIGNDVLFGDLGNDRLLGFKGVDEALGGEGDDVMVWNNGDGTDLNLGEGGFDESEINGSPTAGDAITFAPTPAAAGRVLVDRGNLVHFEVDLSAERLTINGLGGEDTVEPDQTVAAGIAGLTSLALNGGGGEDLLSGGDGADLLRGGDDTDVLRGDGGDDRLLGDRGTDFLAGDEGDDVPVWNNGDGTDTAEGGAGFDRLEVNGSPTAGDQLKLTPFEGDAVLQRTNLVPFAVNLTSLASLLAPEPYGGVEAVAVDGGGGDDGFVVAPGLAGIAVTAAGGAGADELTGAEEADSFFGGSGSDTLIPGQGSDLADGQEGDDRLLTRDLVGDLVRGGAGSDIAVTDATTVDAVDGVEALDATQPPAPPAPVAGDTTALLPKLGKLAVVAKGGALLVRAPLACPAAEAGGCRTTLTLETARAARVGGVRAVLVLGSKSVRLGPGQSSTATVRLVGGSAGLAKRGALAARVRIASSDAAGNSAVRSLAATLRVPR